MKRTTEEIDRHVGAKLRILREANGFSQASLANRVGLTFQQIQKYEHGKNRVSASRLWQFCEELHVTPNDFFEGLDNKVLAHQESIPPRVVKTAWHLHQLRDSGVKNSMLELIRHCKSGGA